MKLKNLIFLDTETTGSEEQDRLCQLAYKYHKESLDEMFDKNYKPPIPISIESMAVHHITEEMVENEPLFKESKDYMPVKNMLESRESIMVAHNAPFDSGMLLKENIKVNACIDTLKIVRHFDPNMTIKRHNLQYLRYLLKLDKDINIKLNAHDAKSDVIVLELLFNRLYVKAQEKFSLKTEEELLAKMIELSNTPAYIGKFAFGKYSGQSVSEIAQIDPQYLKWLLRQKMEAEQVDEDWIFTLKKTLSID